MHFQSIDIFCHIVDNFGDIGFVYRFAREFKIAVPRCALRVFVDDLETFRQINPAINPALTFQQYGGVEYVTTMALTAELIERLDVADVLVEAFACRIPEAVLKAAESRPRVIINLEHLSAEAWVEGYHLKESLLPVETLKKYFFMPGFTKETGGLLLDPRIARIKPRLAEHRRACLNGILRTSGCAIRGADTPLIGTVFTYLRGFDTLLADLNELPQETVLLVFGHKSAEGMSKSLARAGGRQIGDRQYRCGNATVVFMPFIPQPRYDALLCLADFNMVRGEDSLVRAILAGKPFIWNAYLQDNKYHTVKIEAFLERFKNYFSDEEAFSRYRDLLLLFNDAASESPVQVTQEHYRDFFLSLSKLEHATREMSYFTTQNCNLVQKFAEFLTSL